MCPPTSLTIPFGIPVVPEVYKIYENSFELIYTQSVSLALDNDSFQLISFGELSFTS